MRTFFKIFWKIILAIFVILGLLVVLGIAISGYLGLTSILNWGTIVSGVQVLPILKGAVTIMQNYGLYIAIGCTVLVVLFIVFGICYGVFNSKRKKHSKNYNAIIHV